MAVAAINQYKIHPGGRDAFLEAARETFKLIEGLGGRATLRQILVGGDSSGTLSSIAQFPNTLARGAYLDAITQPDNVAKNAVVQLQRSGGVTLIGRTFLNETPATEDLPSQSPVLQVGRYRVVPGKQAEGEAALNEAKSLRQSLGIECHMYDVANAGANSGARQITTHAGSHKELAEILMRLAERTEGRPRLRMATEEGILALVSTHVSTLVTL